MTSPAAGGAQAPEARVRFVSRSASVPAMRMWLGDVLGDWGDAEVRDDVLLAATELTANSMLHSGGAYFEVALRVDDDACRVLVEDPGASPASAIAHRSGALPTSGEDPEAESTTGRGLLLVSALSRAWGIEEFEGGTRVWADFAVESSDYTAIGPAIRDGQGRVEPRGGRTIELRGCPPDLLLAHDSNLADTARELRLFGATHGDPSMAAAAERIAKVVRLSAVSWDAARLLAVHALQDGLTEVDIATAPTEWHAVPSRVAILRESMRLAESMMEQGLLMALPAPDAVQKWRDWVEVEMTGQVLDRREPQRFEDWLRNSR